MPVDQERYRSLIARTAFNCEFFRGTIQDLSSAQRAMTFVGTPTWSLINSRPAFKQSAAADGSTSGVVAAVVDVTGAFSVEWIGVPHIAGVGSDTLISQVGATGGFLFAWDCTNAVYVLSLYDNAGVLARSITTPAASAVVQEPAHVIIRSSAGGTAGAAWIRGLPVAATLAGAGAAANIGAASAIVSGGGGVGIMSSLASRAAQASWSNEDVTCLYQQARLLTGGDV